MLFIILCLVSCARSAGTNCTVKNNQTPTCTTGDCQYRIYGSFNSSGVKFNGNGELNQYKKMIICPLIIEDDALLSGNSSSYCYFDRIEVKANHVATFGWGKYLSHNNFILNENSRAIMKCNFSFNSPLTIRDKRESNKPLIICDNCINMELLPRSYPYRPGHWFNVSYGYENCIDIVSYPDEISKYVDNEIFTIKVYEYPVIDLGLYLMANKKLVRYCKNKVKVDRIVECSMNKYQYNPSYSSSKFSFDYPHCPCTSDENSTCTLTTGLDKVSFGDSTIKQTFNMYKDLTIENSKSLDNVVIKQLSTLT